MYLVGCGFMQVVEKLKKGLEYFVGGDDSIMHMLIILATIAVFTETLTLILRKKFTLKRELKIILRKLLALIVVGVINLFDANIVFFSFAFRPTVILFYMLQEVDEIFDNLDIFGVCIPPAARKILKILDQNIENNGKSKI